VDLGLIGELATTFLLRSKTLIGGYKIDDFGEQPNQGLANSIVS
jgi:hypothetical protein